MKGGIRLRRRVFVGKHGIELTCQVARATKPPARQSNGVYPGIRMEPDGLVQIGISHAEV